MSFTWNRIHKWEENHERAILDDVTEFVCEHYDIDDVFYLTDDQFLEIVNFARHELAEYSVMQSGFSQLISYLENL
jgi:hypothetical protein